MQPALYLTSGQSTDKDSTLFRLDFVIQPLLTKALNLHRGDRMIQISEKCFSGIKHDTLNALVSAIHRDGLSEEEGIEVSHLRHMYSLAKRTNFSIYDDFVKVWNFYNNL